MGKLFKNIITIILFLVNFILPPFVFMSLWKWFAMPVLNVPMVGFWEACGIFLLISYFRNFPKYEKADDDELLTLELRYLIRALLMWCLGFLYHSIPIWMHHGAPHA